MRILDRYLGRAVIGGALMALLVLVAIDTFFAFLNEVQDIGRGSYGLPDILVYVMLGVPQRMHTLFPMAALLGSLMALGGLAAHSELIAIRAAGISIGRIIFSVLKAGLLLLVFAAAVGEWVAPPAQQLAQNYRAEAQTGRVTFRSAYGVWARDGRHFIRIGEILPDGVLRRVEIHELGEDGRLVSLLRAKEARYRNGAWELANGVFVRLTADGFSLEPVGHRTWRSVLSPELLNVVVIKPEELSGRDLWRYVRYLEDNGLDAARYRLALWRRVLAPFAGMVMLFLSIPFVFGSLRTTGAGQRLLLGILVGLGFYLADQVAGNLGQVYGLPPLAAAAAPSLAFLAIGLWAMRRVR